MDSGRVHVRKIFFSPLTTTYTILKDIAKQEGVGALWKGIGATLIGIIPARAIYFSTYFQTKLFLQNRVAFFHGENKEHVMIHLSSAVCAGLAVATATNPIWMVKTRLQLNRNSNESALACISKIYSKEGLGGFYRGMSASYLGIIEGAIQWIIYENIKKSSLNQGTDANWGLLFSAAAMSKLVAAVIAYPHEVIRTRLREVSESGKPKYGSILQTCRIISREEGFRGFYGGMTAHLLRVVPNSAIMFFCFEIMMHGYAKFDARRTVQPLNLVAT